MALDVEALLQPISEEEPSGPDLSYDRDFRRISRELDEAAQKERPGDDPAVQPAVDTAVELLGKSHDLWVASHGFCFALYAGDLALGAQLLDVMAGIVRDYWENCHPALDEGSDPASGRREACRQIASIGRVVKHLERLYLAPLKTKGRLSFQDIAGGAAPSAGGAQILAEMPEQIRLAVRDTPVEPWAEWSGQLGALLASVNALLEAFSTHGSGQEPDLSAFQTAVKRMKSFADAVIAEKSPEAAAETAGGEGDPAADPGDAPLQAVAAAARAPTISGPIATRQQALAQLDAVKAFFQQTEPSSPLPLLIDRVKKLAGMDFMAIMQNLAPGGVDEAARILEPPVPEEPTE